MVYVGYTEQKIIILNYLKTLLHITQTNTSFIDTLTSREINAEKYYLSVMDIMYIEVYLCFVLMMSLIVIERFMN